MGRLLAALDITCSFIKIGSSLLKAWLTLGWNVRKARKSFEAELRKTGMSKEDTEMIGKNFSELRKQMMDTLKAFFRANRKKQKPS